MKYFVIISAILFCSELCGQQNKEVSFFLKSGDSIEGVVKLRVSERDGNVFPSDEKDFIKYTKGNEKIKIQKSEILSISAGSKQYEVIYDSARDHYSIGYFVTRGKKSLYKTYSYGRMTTYASGLPQQSINKVVNTTYLLFNGKGFEIIRWKKDPKVMIAACDAYADYHSIIKRWKTNNIEDAFKYFNENCK